MRRSLVILVSCAALAAFTTVALGVVNARPGSSFGAACAPASSPTTDVERERDADNVELDETVIVTPRIEVSRELQPGDTFTCELMIRSRRADRATFQLEPNGVVGSQAPNASYEFVPADDDRFAGTAGPWLQPAVDEVTLEPRDVIRVPVTITVPVEPPVGSAYGSINVVSRASAPAGETALGIASEAATVFLLRIGGEGAPELELVGVNAPWLRWDREAWPVTGSIDNDGTLHTAAGGSVRITSLLGNAVAELPIGAETILPGGREPLAVRWGGVPWFGIYRYEVRVEDTGDDARSSDTASGWFVALPPWWVLLILAAIIAGYLRLRRRLRDNGREDHDHEMPEDVEHGDLDADHGRS